MSNGLLLGTLDARHICIIYAEIVAMGEYYRMHRKLCTVPEKSYMSVVWRVLASGVYRAKQGYPIL